MDWTAIIIAVVSGLLSGTVGVAIVSGLFNKRMNGAQVKQVEIDGMHKVITAMQCRLDKVHGRINHLETVIEGREVTIDKLKAAGDIQDETIDKLTDENRDLKRDVTRLRKDVCDRDKKIFALTVRVKDLEESLKRLADSGHADGTDK